MIAQSFTNWDTDTTYHYPTYYIQLSAPSRYYWETDPKPTAKELRDRWWKYIAVFAKRAEEAFTLLPILIRKIQLPRIHHERQYPRIIKYRNNRLP